MNVDSGWDSSEGWLEAAAAWRAAAGAPPVVLLLSNDVHELRGYNRLAAAAVAELLVFAQVRQLHRSCAQACAASTA